jgi:hypothetical protein
VQVSGVLVAMFCFTSSLLRRFIEIVTDSYVLFHNSDYGIFCGISSSTIPEKGSIQGKDWLVAADEALWDMSGCFGYDTDCIAEGSLIGNSLIQNSKDNRSIRAKT